MANRYTFEQENLNTKQIAFKSGLQSSLNTLISNGGATEGTFYLTTDTHRLYIGRKITKDGETTVNKTIPIPVNEGIQVVETLADLDTKSANPGEFYYVSGTQASPVNVLCIYNGTEWVQINPDTNTNDNDDTQVTSIAFTNSQVVNGIYVKATAYNNTKTYQTCNGTTFTQVATNQATALNTYYEKISDTGKSIIYTVTIGLTDYDRIPSTPDVQGTSSIVTYFVLNSTDLIATSQTGITSSEVANDSTTISLDGGVADNSKTVTVTGTGGVSLSGNANNIQIKGNTYSIARGSATSSSSSIILNETSSGSDSNVASISISAGNNLEIDTNDSTGITIKHAKPTGSGSYYGNSSTTPAEGGTITIPKFKTDANGHVTNVSNVSVTLPTANNIKAIGVNSSDKSKLELTTNGDAYITSGEVLYFTVTTDDNNSPTTIKNQGNLGHIYTADYIDTLIETQLKGINALVYKGTVGGQSSTVGSATLPTTNVAIGDVYMADGNSATITYTAQGDSTSSAHTAHAGDLFIAQSSDGTEGTDGKIVSSKVRWTYVAAGDIDTRYSLSRDNNKIKLVASTDPTSYTQSISTTGTGVISVTASTDSQNSNDFLYEVSHNVSGIITNSDNNKSFGPSDGATLTAGGSFTIPYITVDKYGHITAEADKTFTLPQSNNDNYLLRNTSDSGATIANNAVYDTTIRLFKNTDVAGTITLAGDTANTGGVTVTASTNTININHQTFGTPTGSTDSLTVPDTGNNANQFSAISAITTTNGHVTGITTKTFTLHPYTLVGSAVSGTTTKSVTNSLMQNSSTKGTITYQSSTLDISSNYSSNSLATTYTIDLKWGTF